MGEYLFAWNSVISFPHCSPSLSQPCFMWVWNQFWIWKQWQEGVWKCKLWEVRLFEREQVTIRDLICKEKSLWILEMRNKYAKCILGKKNSGRVIEGNNTECRQQIHQEMCYNTVPGGRNSMHSLKGEGPSPSDFSLFYPYHRIRPGPFPKPPLLGVHMCVNKKKYLLSHWYLLFYFLPSCPQATRVALATFDR